MSNLVLANCAPLYSKIDGLKRADVESLTKWIDLQPHLPKLTEMQVINFLHSNNFSNEAAKRCIDDFYTVKTHSPEFFQQRDPNVLDLGMVMYYPMPKKTPQGYRVLMGQLIDNNPDRYSQALQIKLFDMTIMLLLNGEGPSDGFVFVFDLTGLTFAHLTKLNLMMMKKFFFYLQECMPLRIKGMHFVNIGNFMDKIMSLIRPFMKKELLEVLHTHPTFETIEKFIPKENFPKDYPGGKEDSVEALQNKSRECLKSNCKFFMEEETQKVDESQRPGKPKNPGDVFGVEGTFKKLDID